MDAWDLAQAFAPEKDINESIKSYENQMFKRGFKNAEESLKSTYINFASGWKAVVRNIFMWLIGFLLCIYNRYFE